MNSIQKNSDLNNIYQELSDSGKIWVSDTEKKLRYIKSLWLLHAAICVLSPLILIFFVPNGEDVSIWFQRSGSIVIVFSLLAELRAVEYKNIAISNEKPFLLCNRYMKQKYKSTSNFINSSTLLLIALGTLIWGYGDILYKII